MPDSQSQAYSDATQLVLNSVKRAVETRWRTAFANGFTQQMLDMVLSSTVPQIAALEKMVAGLAANFLSARTGRKITQLEADSRTPLTDVRQWITNSYVTGRKVLKDGGTQEDALAQSLDQLLTNVDTGAEEAKIKQSQNSLIEAGESRYKRVVHSEKPCALCLIASTRVYYIEDLLPIHERCQCDVDTIQPGDISLVNGKEYVGLDKLKIPDELLAEGTRGPKANPNSDRSILKGYLQDLQKRQFAAGLQGWENAITTGEATTQGGVPKLMARKGAVKAKETAETTAKNRVTTTVQYKFTTAKGAITDEMSWDESMDAFKAAHPNVKIVGWNSKTMTKINGNSDSAAIHKEWFQGISDVLARYPDAEKYLTEIRLEDTGRAFAHVQQVPGSQGRESIMTFDQSSVSKPEKFLEDMRNLEKIGQVFPGSAERPGYSTAIHEMGHVLDNYTFETVSYRMEESLPYRFLEWTGRNPLEVPGGFDPMKWDEDIYKEWGSFLADNMSTYSFEPTWATPKLNPPEAMAEAFGDVWINGKNASITSREIVLDLDKSVESARRHDAKGQ